VEISAGAPVFFDPYKFNHATGSFILIDPLTNNTVAAGMIRGVPREIHEMQGDAMPPVSGSADAVWSKGEIVRETREERNGHRAAVLWFTGYSGSGKSTIAGLLEKRLFRLGCRTMLLDGDHMRNGLCRDLGFSEMDRQENIRRAGEVARLFFDAGDIVICAFISPFIRDRGFARSLFPEKRFFEIHVRCSLETCIRRDPHGLYRKAFSGEIPEFTGISSPYEEPPSPEITAETEIMGEDRICDLLIRRLVQEGIIRKDSLDRRVCSSAIHRS
jgi:bifunctional enzyme CysN/CysC